eukprot:4837096-Pleurochrysis_carterae.AAC.1
MAIVASLHYRLGRILMYGWTMPYKWGHPVATLPVTNGTIGTRSCRDDYFQYYFFIYGGRGAPYRS